MKIPEILEHPLKCKKLPNLLERLVKFRKILKLLQNYYGNYLSNSALRNLK